jgi:glutamyl-tRNA synthetase
MNFNIRTRVGPSPTGDPHIGTAYIALFNYMFAQKYNGAFLIRVEDTDKTRYNKGSEFKILKFLKWLKLDWQEGPDIGGQYGPYRQSDRLHHYLKYTYYLLNKGFAYWCSCNKYKLTKLKLMQISKGHPTQYNKCCLKKSKHQVMMEILSSAEGGVIRLNVPRTGNTYFHDIIRGKIFINNLSIDDQILIKNDGFPTYHLANVVDDHLMKITHIIRGEEWLTSTAKHILLYNAMGFKIPYFCHLPLLRSLNKEKISKRKNNASLEYYKKIGILPQTIKNFLASISLSGCMKKEIFSLNECIRKFSLHNVSLGSPVFDVNKLIWLNGRYIREQLDEFNSAKYIIGMYCPLKYMCMIVPLVRDRIERHHDLFEYINFFFSAKKSLVYTNKCTIDKLNKKATNKIYLHLIENLKNIKKYTARNIKTSLNNFCDAYSLERQSFLMSVRFLVTGTEKATPLFLTMSILGKSESQNRIKAILSRFNVDSKSIN